MNRINDNTNDKKRKEKEIQEEMKFRNKKKRIKKSEEIDLNELESKEIKTEEIKADFFCFAKEKEKKKTRKINKMFELYYGVNTPKDQEESKKICEEESEKGNLIAKGFKNFLGWKCEKDMKKSFEYFRESLESKEYTESEKSYSMNMIGFLYEGSEPAIEKNLVKAIDLYEKASMLGNCISTFNLACIYKEGKAFEKNIPKAVEFFEKAMLLGDIDAIFELANIYEEGVKKKKKNSFFYKNFFISCSKNH